MELYSLEIIAEEFLEEHITRLAYEEIKSAIQIEYVDNKVKIIVYGSNPILDYLIKKIDKFISDYFSETGKIVYNKQIVEDKDWNELWKESFNCIEFGNKIVIKPSFKDYSGNIQNIIIINPSVGFGSGEHPTTQLVIEKLIDMDLEKKKILDIGSGSGILSLISLKLGADIAFMVEIDADAGENSKENFQLNNLENKFNLIVGDFSEQIVRNNIREKFDIILMNILPSVILNLLPYTNKFLNPNGEIILSGIISERFDEIKDHLDKNNYKIINTVYKDNWVRIDCKII